MSHRAGFTILEALVSVALLLAVMLAVADVFSMTSLASGRAVGQAETIEAAATFEQAVRTQLEKLKPDSLLIIESPPPLTLMPETKAGPNALSLRHDRLVFIAQSTGSDTFRSQTDRSVASNTGPGRAQFTAPEALIYFGPGDPDGRGLANIMGQDWILSQRIVLLGAAANAFASFTGEAPIAQYPLGGLVNAPPQGIYACGVDAVQEISDAMLARIAIELAAPAGNITGLWDLNLCPSEINAIRPTGPTDNYFFYGRAAFNLAPRIADLRIEWTDGSQVDPTDPGTCTVPLSPAAVVLNPSTQWFGQPRDTADIPSNPPPPNSLQGWTAPAAASGSPCVTNSSGDVCAKGTWVAAFPAADPAWVAGGGGIETVTGPANGPYEYRAIWIGEQQFHLKPKALRFTFRVYDQQNRLAVNEAYDTTPWTSPTLWTVGGNPQPLHRFGLEYSFVVKLPE